MKRFLSLFAIMALIVSMFSGVGFAAVTPAATYALAVDSGLMVRGTTSQPLTVTAHADLEDYTVAVYNSDSEVVLEKAVPDTGIVVLDGEDISGLAVGTYTVNIKEAVEISSEYVLDEDNNNAYDAATDAKVTTATFDVMDASISNISAGSSSSQVVGTIDIADGTTLNMTAVSLEIKDTDGAYEQITKKTGGKLFVDDSDTAFESGDVVKGTAETGFVADEITGLYINTVDFLLATFTSAEGGANTTVLDYFSDYNETGTLDLRLVATIGGETIHIDFTYSAVPLKIELNEDMFNFDENGGNVTISGKIVNKNTEAAYDYDTDNIVALSDDGDRVFDETFSTVSGQVDSVNNGQFDITFNAYNEDDGIEFFWVCSEDNTPTRGDYFFTTNGADHFVLTPEFEIDSDLEFEFPFSGTIEIDGVFVNDDNDFNAGAGIDKSVIKIMYLDGTNEFMADGTLIATAVLANDKVFGFLDGGDAVTMTGDIGLFFDGVRVATGEVTPGELTLEVSPDEVPKNLGNQELTFSFDLGSDYYTEDALVLNADMRLILKVEDEDGNTVDIDDAQTKFNRDSDDELEYKTVEDFSPLAGYVVIADDEDDDTNGLRFTSATSQEVIVSLAVNGWEKGTYTAYVKLYDTDATHPTVIQETSVEFEVEKPSAYNLIGWGLDETSVGTTTFTFNASGSADQTVVVKDDEGIEIEYLEVVFNGCGLEDKTFANPAYDSDDTEDFEISVSETGTLEVKINVYTDENDETPDKTFTEEIKITGWNVEVTPSEIVVDSEVDVTITITDEDGDPVNNAIVKIGNADLGYTTVVNGTTSSIIGGVYVYEYDEDTLEFGTVAELDVKCYKGSDSESDLEVTLEGEIEVVGETVYTVEAVENAVLLNGLEEEVKISVLDTDGDIVYPTFYRIDVDSDGDESSAVEIPSGDLGSYTDVDGVAGKEARTITLKPDASQQAIIIRATTDAGAKMGEVRIEVQKPQLVMDAGQKLTENFTNELEFTVIDPRDNSVLENDVYLKAEKTHIDYSVEDSEGSSVTITDGQSDTITFDDTYKFDLFVDDVNWELAEDDEADVEIELYISLDEDVNIVDFAIEKATLTSTPESVIIGAGTNIVLTYTDANGVALEDYDVTLDDDEVGTTDENGQVVYSASSTSSVSLTFEVDTDDSSSTDSDVDDDDDADTTTTSVKVKSAADTQPPVATFEVNGKSAIITITDNVRLLKSFVNKQEVNMYFPMPNATHIVEGLKAGDNEVHVLSSDTKGNILDTVLVITVEATIEPVTFTIGVDTEFGAPALVEETTMVPVRFAEQLGAVVDWDNETQTVTYTLGDTVISMTVGSKTAVVNGENTQLTVAPYKNELGRTMVPLRMIAQDLGFTVEWTSNDAPITIK